MNSTNALQWFHTPRRNVKVRGEGEVGGRKVQGGWERGSGG